MLPGEEKHPERFEAALKRALAGADARAGTDCPGPDVLAAYYDRAMNRVDRQAVEAHLAQCARCASTLAMMARAGAAARSSERAERPRAWFWMTRVVAPASVVAVAIALTITMRSGHQTKPELLAMASRRAASPARHGAAAMLSDKSARQPAPAPAPSAAAGQATSPEQKQAPPSAPAAEKSFTPALAGAVGGYAASAPQKLAAAPAPAHEGVRQGETPLAAAPAPTSAPEEIARNEASPAPALAPPAEIHHKATTAETETSEHPAPETLAKGATGPALKPETVARPSGSAAEAPAASATAPAVQLTGPAAHTPESPMRQPAAPQMQAGATAQAQTQFSVASQPRAPAGSLSASAEGGSPAGRAMAEQKSLQAFQAGTVAAPSAVFETSVSGGGNQIYSPDHRTAWQIGPGGAVLRWTTDTGWRPQRSGVSVDLLAGTAPSSTVCWLVGKSGIVIHTEDGGEHWEMAAAPTTQNLLQVAAKDADNASVITADGTRFTTHDGGVTWSSP